VARENLNLPHRKTLFSQNLFCDREQPLINILLKLEKANG
jgi:hypothetical protein